MAVDCLQWHLSRDSIDLILRMSDYDKRRIFELIKAAGYYVNPRLLNK